MHQQQFLNILKHPQNLATDHLKDLEILVNEYPFFETAHLLYTKGLHRYQSLNYSKQLRKTAIIANSRSVLYELIHNPAEATAEIVVEPITQQPAIKNDIKDAEIAEQEAINTNPVTITNNEIKVVYVNTVSDNIKQPEIKPQLEEQVLVPNAELEIIKTIENETVISNFDESELNTSIEKEINKSIIQSYVQADIIKTPELNKEDTTEPSSFTEWLKAVQKENHTYQIDTKGENELKITQKEPETTQKPSFFSQNKQIIDKIIESDPGRIKLGTNKFFTPAVDAKQSLLENEHLVTETLAKIYALQGNISKAIRAYEILSLKFPQKSVYFASLIEKLKKEK